MTSLIKNQILKHLSKFAKNLSHDQFHLSALKGEGELKNLELDEEILTDLLELPNWLRLSKATCNRVTVRIQWTKLKTVPIHLFLDEVLVEIETCEDLRSVPKCGGAGGGGGGHAYGFADKVVDGITLNVNSVLLTLKSRAFTASIQMARIVVESKSPTWQKAATDLRLTRIKDTDRDELLTFKELTWHTVRIEAKSTRLDEDVLTPLRLITNQARCRITIKKKISDCSVLGCRLVLILDDLLWVLTDDQLKAALHYADSLSGLLKRATAETQKVKGARKLRSLSTRVEKGGGSASKKRRASSSQCVTAKVFARYDVTETSYHLYSDRIDLHLCDDPGGKGRSFHPKLSNGGSFQVSLHQLQVDFYPYHLVGGGNRSSWIRYPPGTVHSVWLDNSLRTFRASLLEAAERALSLKGSTTSTTAHTPLTRTDNAKASNSASKSTNGDGGGEKAEVEQLLLRQFGKLMTTNLVVRLNNLAMWKVSTKECGKAAAAAPQEFISGDRERFSLPDDMPLMHFEYTQFYHPGDTDFPLPPPKLFAHFNPIQLSFDPLTVLWLNAFALNLQTSVKLLSVEQAEPPYLDVKIEAIMLRVSFESEEDDHLRQKHRPRTLQVQASRILVSNYRGLETGSKADLASCLDKFHQSDLFVDADSFPNQPCDIPVVCDKLFFHATGDDAIQYPDGGGDEREVANGKDDNPTTCEALRPIMKKDLLWTESRDVWRLALDPLWAEFHGTRATGSRRVPLADAFPLQLWLYRRPDADDGVEGAAVAAAKMHLLVQVDAVVSVQLNHFQLLFLLRLLDTIGEITTFLTHDVKHVVGDDDDSIAVVGLVTPQVDVSLLMPSSAAVAAAKPKQQPKQEVVTGGGGGEVVEAAASSSVDVEPAPKQRQHAPPSPGSASSSVLPPQPPMKHFSASVNKMNALTSSLSNMMTQLDIGGGGGGGEDADVASCRSDDSEDFSESFLVINHQLDTSVDNTLFATHSSKRTSPVEMAAEVTEDDDDDNNDGGGGSLTATTDDDDDKDDGFISVVTFRLVGVQAVHQSATSSGRSFLKLRCASLCGDERPAVSWEDFQSDFSARGTNKYEPLPPPSEWCVKLRFTTASPDCRDVLKRMTGTSMSLKEAVSRSTEAFLEAKARNLPLQLRTSTLAGLVDLVEDEIVPTPVPFRLRLDNVALQLVEDRRSVNGGSVPPIEVAVPALEVTRDKTGMFSVLPAEVAKCLPPSPPPHLDLVRSGGVASVETELQQRAGLLAADNANLQGLLNGSKSELDQLDAKLQQVQTTLVKTQKRALSTEAENKRLRESLQHLQQELVLLRSSSKKNLVP